MPSLDKTIKDLSKAFGTTAGGIIVPSGNSSARSPNRTNSNGRVGATFSSNAPPRLPVENEPLRPVNGSLYVARSLAEMAEWSGEVSTAVAAVSQDVFCTSDGDVGSWSVAGARTGTDDEDRAAINPETEAVVRELQQARYGRSYVVGGLHFQGAVSDVLEYGDAFYQVRFAREGLSGDPSDFTVAETYQMPTLETFVLQDDAGREAGYRRMFHGLQDAEDYGLLEMLHFSYRQKGLYGRSPFVSLLPHWESLKRVSPAVESAVVDIGIAPWLHEMPGNANATARMEYEDDHRRLASQGVIKHLYLDNGANVRKAANNDDGLRELIDTWLEYRRAMIPFGLPDYFFSLPNRGSQNKLNLQPAMHYARLIASVRAIIGEQIKWVCDIQVALKLGIEHLIDNPYDIVWPNWEVQPPQRVEVEAEG